MAGPGSWGPLLAPALLALGLGFFSVLLLFVFALMSGLFGVRWADLGAGIVRFFDAPMWPGFVAEVEREA